MSIIEKISERIYYFLDSTKVAGLKVKIEHFILNHPQDKIIVIYRLGRQKLLNKMELSPFEKEYFEKVSNYDQHRLTKFSILQYLLQDLFCDSVCNKDRFASFIEEHAKNEQLL